MPPLIKRFLGLVGLTGVEPARSKTTTLSTLRGYQLRHSPMLVYIGADQWNRTTSSRVSRLRTTQLYQIGIVLT